MKDLPKFKKRQFKMEERDERFQLFSKNQLKTYLMCTLALITGMVLLSFSYQAQQRDPEPALALVEDYVPEDPRSIESDVVTYVPSASGGRLIPFEIVDAYVTGYNTVESQTDSTPCIAASGDNICGRDDVIACPRHIPLHTEVVIDGNTYVCLDRLAPKYDMRFDVSCDKDMDCPNKVTGFKKVYILK